MIYLDNAATTKPCEAAVKAVCDTMRGRFGNASSLHKLGISSGEVLSAAKRTLLTALGSSPAVSGGRPLDGEIYFTSGATESNNTALLGACDAYKRAGKRVVSTTIEHPSVARVLDKLETLGFEVVRLSPKDYDDFAAALADAVDEKTVLVSCMAVNNETGFATDVKRLYKLVKKKNPATLVHIDAVQGFLKVPLDGDFISISGHKIHAPKGIGALYVKKGVRFTPLLLGGGQQKSLRSGTEPVELVAGLCAAVTSYAGTKEHFGALKAHLLERLSELDGITLNSDDRCVPNIVSFAVSGVRSEIMLHILEEQEIYVSSGSACSKGKKSGVLSRFGISDKDADTTLRVSFSSETTAAEIDALCDGIRKGIERVRR